MDVNSINALPDDMKLTFCKLLKHAYSIDSRCQKLVLQLLKLVGDYVVDDDLGNSQDENAPSQHHNTPAPNDACNDNLPGCYFLFLFFVIYLIIALIILYLFLVDGVDPVYCSQYELHN